MTAMRQDKTYFVVCFPPDQKGTKYWEVPKNEIEDVFKHNEQSNENQLFLISATAQLRIETNGFWHARYRICRIVELAFCWFRLFSKGVPLGL
eukprot:SAG11_NODE_934_length_6487_cov_19.842204_2_plen_93_part_00